MKNSVFGVEFSLVDGSVEKTNQKYKDTIVLAKHTEKDNPGKVRICRLYEKGEWNIFSYVPRGVTLKEGYYLCRVMEFKLDRRGYTNLCVAPMAYLPVEDAFNSPVWEYVKEMLSPLSYVGGYSHDWSLNVEDVPSTQEVFECLLTGDVSFMEEIAKKLLQPSCYSRLAEAWQESSGVSIFQEKYPNLSRKYATLEGGSKDQLHRREEFLRKNVTFEEAKNVSYGEIFAKLEADLREKRAARSAANVAKNKAKKAAKQAAKKEA